MFTNKKSNIMAIVLAACLIVCAVCMLILNERQVYANIEIQGEIKPSYNLGENFVAPDATFNGKVIDCKIELPDGTLLNTNTTDLNITGKYKVIYSDKDSGTQKTVVFCVSSEKYYVDKNGAKPVLTESIYTFTDGTTSEGGIIFTLQDGQTFYYDKIYDMSNATIADKLIKFNVLASTPGEYDVNQVNVRFTDLEDENNYFEIQYWGDPNDPDGRGIYIRAGAYGKMASTSKIYNPATKQYGNYSLGSIRSSDSIAMAEYEGQRFVSRGSEPSLAENYNECSIDYDSKMLYGTNYPTLFNFNPTYGCGEIVDLDDVAFFSEPWKGFTNGKCRISISASMYQKDSCTILLRSVLGDVYEDFKENIFNDDTSPKLDIDTLEYEENLLPDGIVGAKYKIFSANAVDFLGNVREVKTKVYFNYNSNNKIPVIVRDGYFIPDKEGIHAIEYTVEDYFGNETKKVVYINCFAFGDIEVLLSDDIQKTGTTGSPVKISDFSVINHSGNYNTKISVFSNSGSEYSVDQKTKTFTPLESGEFYVKYEIVDFLGRTGQKEYTLKIDKETTPVFLDKVNMPKYFIQGETNVVPELTAYDFVGNKEIVADLYVQEGDGAPYKAEGFSFIPKISDDGTDYNISVWYEAKNDQEVVSKYPVYTTLCRNINLIEDNQVTNSIDKSKLFIFDDSVSVDYKKIDTSKTSPAVVHYKFSKSIDLNYANAVITNGFNFNFAVVGNDKNQIKQLSLIFTDCYNSENFVKVTLVAEKPDQIFVSVNNGTKILIPDYNFSTVTLMPFIMNDLNNKIILGSSGTEVLISNYSNGNEFKGFNSGRAYLKLKVENITGMPEMAIESFIGEKFSGFTDVNQPVISVLGTEKNKFYLNEEFTIYPACVLDVIKPYTAVTMSFMLPDGNFAVATDGTILQDVDVTKSYNIKLTQVGSYVKVYKFNDAQIERVYDVVDGISPVITVSEEIKKDYKVGESVTLKAIVKDNISQADKCKLSVQVYNSKGIIESCKLNDSYTFKTAGKYKIMFTAYDENGNYSFVSLNINVG